MRQSVLADKLRVEERRHRVQSALMDWKTVDEISAAEGVDCMTISRDIKFILRRKDNHRVRQLEGMIDLELGKLSRIAARALQGWERSLKNSVTSRVETVTGQVDKDGILLPDVTKRSTTTKGQAGDPSFLKILVDCVRESAKLQGLYSEDDTPLGGPQVVIVGNVDLDQVLGRHAQPQTLSENQTPALVLDAATQGTLPPPGTLPANRP